MNNWNIPEDMEAEILLRDTKCVYCGVELKKEIASNCDKSNLGTWEHIINDENIITFENIARCCLGCNSSKGAKKLSEWIHSAYCKEKGITIDTVAPVIKAALEKGI